jgi:hypothetical protein
MYGVVLRKESILSPQAKRFVSLLLGTNEGADLGRSLDVTKPNGALPKSASGSFGSN